MLPVSQRDRAELVVGLDLLRQRADVAVLDAELIVAGAVLGVVRTHRLVAERFELLESFVERHGRACSDGKRPLWSCCSGFGCDLRLLTGRWPP